MAAAPETPAPQRRVTSRDVAARAGVSQPTVSRVLSGAPGVKQSTRKAVLRALEEMGYVPHAGARAMRTMRTSTIGVVISHITNPFYPDLLEALSTAVARADHRMILWDARAAGEQAAVSAIQQGAVDSVIFTTATRTSAPLQEALRRRLPVVMVNRSLPGLQCDSVTSDNVGGARRIADYFLQHGRRPALISGERGASTAEERARGFRDHLRASNVPLPRSWQLWRDFSYQHGADAMRSLLLEPAPPDAVFCANDLIAFGAVDAVRQAGLRVPEDVWVVGYDDVSVASWWAYDLTTVRQPLADMAEVAVELARERVCEPTRAPRRLRFSAELVIRGSTSHASELGELISVDGSR